MDFDFLKVPNVPPRITRQLLLDLSDDDVEHSLLMYVHSVVGDDPSHRQPAFQRLPTGLKAHYIAFTVDIEVLNGGFNQYFYNSSDELGPVAPEAFETLGLPVVAALMREVLTEYERRAFTIDEVRKEGTLQAFSESYQGEPFKQFDDRYSDMQEEIRQGRIRFIRAHPELFVHP